MWAGVIRLGLPSTVVEADVHLRHRPQRLDQRVADQVGERHLAAAGAGEVVVDDDAVVPEQLDRHRADAGRGRDGQAERPCSARCGRGRPGARCRSARRSPRSSAPAAGPWARWTSGSRSTARSWCSWPRTSSRASSRASVRAWLRGLGLLGRLLRGLRRRLGSRGCHWGLLPGPLRGPSPGPSPASRPSRGRRACPRRCRRRASRCHPCPCSRRSPTRPCRRCSGHAGTARTSRPRATRWLRTRRARCWTEGLNPKTRARLVSPLPVGTAVVVEVKARPPHTRTQASRGRPASPPFSEASGRDQVRPPGTGRPAPPRRPPPRRRAAFRPTRSPAVQRSAVLPPTVSQADLSPSSAPGRIRTCAPASGGRCSIP